MAPPKANNAANRSPSKLAQGRPALAAERDSANSPRETEDEPENSTRTSLDLLNRMGDFLLLLDSAGTILNVTSFTYSPQDSGSSRTLRSAFLGKTLLEAQGAIEDESGFFSHANALLERVLETGHSETVEENVRLPDGVWEYEIHIARFDDGQHSENEFPAENQRAPVICIRVTETTDLHLARLEKLILHKMLHEAERHGNLGTWEYNCETRTVLRSPQLYGILGLAPHEPWKKGLFWDTMCEEERENASATYEAAIKECKPFEFVAHHRRMDGATRCLLTAGVPISDRDGRTIRMAGITKDITDPVRADENLRLLSNHLTRVRDDVCRRVARELHETAGQTLAALKLSLGRLREELSTEREDLDAMLFATCALADSAAREVRMISYLTYPVILDQAGISAGLRWYGRGFEERSGIAVELNLPEDFRRQSQELEMGVFRVVQEALTNVHRHSGSRTVKISVSHDEKRLYLEITDHGRGLPRSKSTSESKPIPGVGIPGMRERVESLDGEFTIFSQPGEGTIVCASLPLQAKRPHARSRAAEADPQSESSDAADSENRAPGGPASTT